MSTLDDIDSRVVLKIAGVAALDSTMPGLYMDTHSCHESNILMPKISIHFLRIILYSFHHRSGILHQAFYIDQ